MNPLLELKDICMSYHTMEGEIPALSHISFHVDPGEFVAIVGPSGCGKSTILNLIAGLLKPEQGSVLIHGKPLEESDLYIGYMLQKDHLFEWYTVWQNVMLGLVIQKKDSPRQKERVRMLLKDYGLEDFTTARPSQLSGGMKQRVALIRTLALDPAFLLLDEPFSALDYQTRLKVADDIGTIIRREKRTALLVTHDISEAISMADRVIVLTAGPASVQKEIPIHLTVPERTPMVSRSAPEFKTYFNEIWKELNTDAND